MKYFAFFSLIFKFLQFYEFFNFQNFMHRVKNTFPFALPLSVGDVVDISELPERELLIANGYVEEVEVEGRSQNELHSIDEAEEALPADAFAQPDKLQSGRAMMQIGIDAGVSSGDETITVIMNTKTKKAAAKKIKVETK